MEQSTICRCICFLETVWFSLPICISLPEGTLPETNSSEDDSFPFGDFGIAKCSGAFAVTGVQRLGSVVITTHCGRVGKL